MTSLDKCDWHQSGDRYKLHNVVGWCRDDALHNVIVTSDGCLWLQYKHWEHFLGLKGN